jgi:hypothetical protein
MAREQVANTEQANWAVAALGPKLRCCSQHLKTLHLEKVDAGTGTSIKWGSLRSSADLLAPGSSGAAPDIQPSGDHLSSARYLLLQVPVVASSGC